MKFFKNLGTQKLLNWFLPAYVFLLPWQARLILTDFSAALPRYGSLSIYATDMLFWVLAVVWIVHMHREKGKAHEDWRRLRLPLAIVLVFFTYAGISLFWTADQVVGREFFYRLMQAGMLAMMIASGVVKQRRVLLALASSGAVQGLFAIQQFFSQYISPSTLLGMAEQRPEIPGVSVIEYADERWLRAYGTLPHPNMLGAFCGVAMLAAATVFWRAYQSLNRRDVIIGWLTFIFSYLGLLFTFSRAAWLATALAGIVYAAIELVGCDRMNKTSFAVAFAKLAFVSALFLVFFSAIFGPLWWSRSVGTGRLAQQSTLDRATLVEQSRELFASRTWFGGGVGSYLPLLVKAYPEQPSYFYQPVHALWRLLIVEYGYVGMAMIVASLIAFMGIVVRFKVWMLAPALLFFLVASSFDHFWYSLPFGMLLAAVLIATPLAKTAETC